MTESDSNQADEIRKTREHFALRVLILLFVINLVNQIDRRGLVVIFPLLQAEWGLNDTQLGLAVSIFTVGRALISLPAGWLADRFGALRILRPLTLLWSLLAAFSGLAGSFLSFIGIRMGVGLADGANGPVDLALIGKVSPKEKRGLFLSIYSVAVYAGSALGVIFAGFIGQLFGWRWVLIIPALFGFLAAIGLLFKAPVQVALKHTAENQTNQKQKNWMHWILQGSLPGIFLGGACGVFASTGLVSWLPSFLIRQFDMEISQAGLLTGGLILPASMVGAVLGGWLSDRLVKKYPNARTWLAVSGLVLAMIFGLAGLLIGSLTGALILFFVSSFCFTLPVSPLLVIVQESLAENHLASGQAVFGLVTQVLGAAPATVVVGWLSDRFGLQSALVLPFVMAGLGGLVIAMTSKRKR